MESRFWMVYGAGKGAPAYRHLTREAAESEARRLARKEIGAAFYVLEARSRFVATAVVEETKIAEITAPDGWIKWDGGECPVPEKAIVEIELRDEADNAGHAVRFRWSHRGLPDDIIAYRVVTP